MDGSFMLGLREPQVGRVPSGFPSAVDHPAADLDHLGD